MQPNSPNKTADYLDQYRLHQTLGQGYHATVRLAHDPDGNPLAIKIYKHTATLETLRHQLEVMKEFDHQNVVRLISVREEATLTTPKEKKGPYLAIVLEYAGGGELFDYVAETGKFTEIVARTYFGQMLNGLHHIHSRGYAHRDIKPQNILLSEKHVLKIADFGFSVLLAGRDGSGVLHTRLGTQGYMAPEIASKSYDGRKVDIFAAGVILFIMYAGSPPFQTSGSNDPYFKCLRNKKYDTFWKSHSRKRPPGYFSAQFKDLFQKLVADNPEDRPSIQQVSQHPWCKMPICSYQEITGEFNMRKDRLHQILSQRRKEQQAKRRQNEEAIRNQGTSNRSGENITEFNKIYNHEFVLKRKLEPLAPLANDFCISADPVMSVSLLKCYLQSQKIDLSESCIVSSDIMEDNSDTLKVEQIVDKQQDHLSVNYCWNYEVDEYQFSEKLVVDFQVGLREEGKGVRVRARRVEGNDLYFRRIVADIRAALQ